MRGPLCWLPFVLLILVFVLGFLGLAYSIYPYVVIDQLTIWQAASSPSALKVILVGVCISVPAIAGVHGVFVPGVPGQDRRAELRLIEAPRRDEMPIRRFVHRLAGWCAGLALMAGAAWLAHGLAMHNGLEQLRIEVDTVSGITFPQVGHNDTVG